MTHAVSPGSYMRGIPFGQNNPTFYAKHLHNKRTMHVKNVS